MISCGFIKGDLRNQEKGYKKVRGMWKSVKILLKLDCIYRKNVKLLNNMKKVNILNIFIFILLIMIG